MRNYRKLSSHLRRFVEAIAAGKSQKDAALLVRPQSRSPKQLGWKLRHIPLVAAAIEELEADAIEAAGVTRTQVLLDAVEIKRRSMCAEPVRDQKGEPTGEYRFDSAGANRANEFLGRYLKIAPERHELTGAGGGPIKSEAKVTRTPTLADFYDTVTRISLEEQPQAPAAAPQPAEPPPAPPEEPEEL